MNVSCREVYSGAVHRHALQATKPLRQMCGGGAADFGRHGDHGGLHALSEGSLIKYWLPALSVYFVRVPVRPQQRSPVRWKSVISADLGLGATLLCLLQQLLRGCALKDPDALDISCMWMEHELIRR